MNKSKRTKSCLFGCGALLLFFVIVAYAIHGAAEKRLFSELSSGRFGVIITARNHSGSILSGYVLSDVEIKKSGSKTPGDFTLKTSSLEIKYKLLAREITKIKWDAGILTLTLSDGSTNEIPLGACEMIASGSYLESKSPVTIGESSWDGVANFKVSRNLKNISGDCKIKKLPGQFLVYSNILPSDIVPPALVELDMEFSGTPGNISSKGSITNISNGQTYRF